MLTDLKVPMEKVCAYWNDNDFDTNFDLRLGLMRRIAEEEKENGLEGSIAEVGVWKGSFSKYLSRAFPDSKYYLFDTFDGFAQDDINYDNQRFEREGLIEDHKFLSNENLVLNLLQNKNNAIIRKGYFPDTTRGIDDEFVFVLIDVDLYKPIFSALEFFWPKMKKGGCIFVHDYQSPKWTGAREAVKAFSRQYGVSYLPYIDIGGSVIFVK